jgi:hypothetical protein
MKEFVDCIKVEIASLPTGAPLVSGVYDLYGFKTKNNYHIPK